MLWLFDSIEAIRDFMELGGGVPVILQLYGTFETGTDGLPDPGSSASGGATGVARHRYPR